MSYTIVSDVCEGTADCIPVCPVDCIYPFDPERSRLGVYIDPTACIDCGACLSVCPVEGAILDVWRPELQTPTANRLLRELVGREVERLEVNLLTWNTNPWEPEILEPGVLLLFSDHTDMRYGADLNKVQLIGVHQLEGNLKL